MIRPVLRNATRFVTAVILLGLLLCAVEIGARGIRLKKRLEQSALRLDEARLVAPDAACYLDVRPLLDLDVALDHAERVHIRTNEYGLRGGTLTVPKPRGVYRILCLGGEEIFGSGLAEEETVSGQLEQLLSRHTGLKVEVLNGGCPGGGPLVHLLRLRHHLLSLQPDLVVLSLQHETWQTDRSVRGALRLDESGAPAYAIHPTLTSQGSELLDGLCEEFVTVDWGSRLAGEWMGLGAARSRSEEWGSGEKGTEVSTLIEMHRLVSATYGSLVISVSPSAWSVSPVDTAPGERNGDSFGQEIRQGLAQADLPSRVPFDDATQGFRQFDDVRRLFSPRSGTLSAEGSRLYAQTLARLIVRSVPAGWDHP